MKRRLSFLALLIFPVVVYAGSLQLFQIGGEFQAPFTSSPVSVGSFDYKGNTFHAYSAADEELAIGFSAIYPKQGQEKYPQEQQQSAIKNFVVGLAEWSNGTLLSVTTYVCDQAQCSDYVLTKNTQGVTIKTYGKVILKNDKFYVWSIKEFVGLSRTDVPAMFEAAKSQFTVF